jgi:Uma2 family endonuclease
MATEVRPMTGARMNGEWKDILEDILPPQGRWTEEEYLVLMDRRSRLVEFTDGHVEALPMPTDQHQLILKFLLFAFANFFESSGGIVQFSPLRLRIRTGKFREPDLLLLRSVSDSRRQNRFWEGADLVAEVVSEDDPDRDLKDKRLDYAEGRIPEYWIINPLTETITVLHLVGDAYQEAGVYHRCESARAVLDAKFTVAVDAVFDAAKKK